MNILKYKNIANYEDIRPVRATLCISMTALLLAATNVLPYSTENHEAWATPDNTAEVDNENVDSTKNENSEDDSEYINENLEGKTSSELESKASNIRDEIATMQSEVDEASDAYYKALDEQEKAEQESKEAQERIDEANDKIVNLQSDINMRAVDLYKNGGDTMDGLQMLLAAQSLDEFIDTWHYLTCVVDSDANMISKTEKLKEEVVKDKMYADEQAMIAKSKATEATQIKEETEAKIEEYEAYLETLDEKAKEKAREEAVEAAMAASASSSIQFTPSADIPANGTVVDYAKSRLGCPYVWAASGPSSFDCSGLVMWCYAQVGISLPHYTEAQYSSARAVLPVSQAEPGDVLYMPGHVGICISSGGGSYIHAPTPGDVVRVSNWPMFSCALRF